MRHGDRTQIGRDLGLTHQTIENNLQSLVDRNWIGYNRKKKLYHIRGIQAIKDLEKAKGRLAIEVNVLKELPADKTHFEAMIYGAYIGSMIEAQKMKERRELREGRQKGDPKQKRGSRQSFYPVALDAIAHDNWLGVARSTACSGRSLAIEKGYLRVQKSKRYQPIRPKDHQLLLFLGGEYAKCLRLIGGQAYLQETLHLKHAKLSFCRIPKNRQKYKKSIFSTPTSPIEDIYYGKKEVSEAVPF